MHRFLKNNRVELIRRCKVKVSHRPLRSASDAQLADGVPLFLDQLTRVLEVDENQLPDESLKISGPSGGVLAGQSGIGLGASAHGQQLLDLGFTVDQVVHDYGDLCQAITDLAFELEVPFAIEEFRTLNRCLDNAIAEAVTAFNLQHDSDLLRQHEADARQQVGFLVHELRNALGTATLAASAMDLGGLTMAGATGGALKRALADLNTLMTRALEEVRGTLQARRRTLAVATLITDIEHSSALDAIARGCRLTVPGVEPSLMVHANAELLQAAVANLLQNAYKFTEPDTEITLRAHATESRVLIEVEDHCGGLPPGGVDTMFTPFHQRKGDRTGLGLGLSIARQSIEADAGTLSVKDVPGIGCVFTISLPRVDVPDAVVA